MMFAGTPEELKGLQLRNGPDGVMTEIGPGVAVPLPLYLEHRLADRTLKMTINLVGDRLQCVSLEIVAAAGVAITSDDLRCVQVGELITLAGRQMFRLHEVHGGATTHNGPLQPPQGFPNSGPTDETLRFIASFYHLAYALGQPPTKTLQELGLTYSTAARWVALARAAGHIDRTEPGRATGKRNPKDGEASP